MLNNARRYVLVKLTLKKVDSSFFFQFLSFESWKCGILKNFYLTAYLSFLMFFIYSDFDSKDTDILGEPINVLLMFVNIAFFISHI